MIEHDGRANWQPPLKIIEMMKTHTAVEVAKVAGVCAKTVYRYRCRYKIVGPGPRAVNWTDDDDKLLRDSTIPHGKAAKLIGKKEGTVRRRRLLLGIGKNGGQTIRIQVDLPKEIVEMLGSDPGGKIREIVINCAEDW
jgi:hypothetical protein